METMKAFAKRKSTRSYDSGKPLAKADLEAVLAAGCAAPVGAGDYPSLHLTVIQDPAALAEISKAAKEAFHTENDPLYGAPALVVVSASEEQKFPGIEYANAGCIVENMLVAAAGLGIDSVYLWGATVGMAGNRALWTKMGVPEGFHPVSGAALGYAAQADGSEKELAVSLSVNYV